MKVTGTNGVGAAQSARGGARPAAGGFSIAASGQAQEAARTAPVSGPGAISSIDALLAMQSVGGPLERRRRAVSRAGRILDVLDEVKLSLLDGGVSAEELGRLVSAVREQRENTEDERLEGVLDEIETRAAVELAKLAVAA
jgi:hypothetical protein